MEITTGTGLGASLSAIRLFWINNIASRLSKPISLLPACKTTTLENSLILLSSFLFLYCDHYMPRVTAKKNWPSECNPDVNGDTLPSLDAETRSFAPINSISALPKTLFIHESQTEIRAGQHLIEDIHEQATSVTRENGRLFQRDLTPDPKLSSNQVLTVAPSKSQMVDLTTTSSNTTSTTPWSLPIPFDVGFNHNITTTCQNFMNDMLSSTTFKQCSPISMLLQVSSELPFNYTIYSYLHELILQSNPIKFLPLNFYLVLCSTLFYPTPTKESLELKLVFPSIKESSSNYLPPGHIM